MEIKDTTTNLAPMTSATPAVKDKTKTHVTNIKTQESIKPGCKSMHTPT